LLAALALATILVQPGDTLSGIAASHGVSLAALEGANPQISDFNMIYPGESVHLPGGATGSSAPVQHYRTAHTSTASAVRHTSSATTSYSSPSSTASVTAPAGSFQSCVIQRESGGNAQVMNSSGHYGLYQFSASTWAASGGNPADFGHASVSEQNHVFQNAYAQFGTSPWGSYDGC
jgi:LysM repeat protein